MDKNFEKYLQPNMMNLQDKYAIKILICYFLRQINRPITPNQLAEIATSDGVVNYFTYAETVEEMLRDKMLRIEAVDEINYYVLSQEAYEAANEFKGIVPKSFRDKIISSGLKFFAKLKDSNIIAEVKEVEKGAEVHFLCQDSGANLMDLTLFAPDLTQAEYIKKKVMLNPSAFYGKILDFVIENEEYTPDLTGY